LTEETVKVHVWGNLKAMTEKGEIFKNYQTKTDLLESKISKNILVDYIYQFHANNKFVNDLRRVGGFLRVLWFPSPINLTTTI
jgi:hypothetical protein